MSNAPNTKREDVLIPLISKIFNGSTVEDVKIDDEFGNVTARVAGRSNIDCGFIDDYPVA